MTRRPIPPNSRSASRELKALIAKAKEDPTHPHPPVPRRRPGSLHAAQLHPRLAGLAGGGERARGLLTNDIAPNASEALLAAFGSCLAVGIHANAIARGIPIRSLELELEADINTTALWGTVDVDPKPIGFETVRVSVLIDADASAGNLGALVEHATLWSPVANTLHNPVHLDVSSAAGGSR